MATTPGISLALTLACNALPISSLWASLLRGAAMPVKGAAGIMLAAARAAVCNSASRRVIDPVICVLKDETAGGSRWDTTCAHRNTDKTAQTSPPAWRNATTVGYHLSSDSRPVQGKRRQTALSRAAAVRGCVGELSA